MAALGPWVIQNDLKDDFELAHEIGAGTYATVYVAQTQSTGEIYAVKSISKEVLFRNSSNMKAMINEIQVLRHCNHP